MKYFAIYRAIFNNWIHVAQDVNTGDVFILEPTVYYYEEDIKGHVIIHADSCTLGEQELFLNEWCSKELWEENWLSGVNYDDFIEFETRDEWLAHWSKTN